MPTEITARRPVTARLLFGRAGLAASIVLAAGLLGCAAPREATSSSGSTASAGTTTRSATPIAMTAKRAPTESAIAAALAASDDQVRRYHQIVTTLSDPFFEGRAPGTRGVEIAADMLDFYFTRIGLEPFFVDDSGVASFRQTFEVTGPLEVVRSGASWTTRGQTRSLTEGTDFNVLGFSGNAEASAELVFVGYAIENGEDGYKTFGDEDDLSGKIAVMFRFEPMDAHGKSKWAENAWSPRAGLAGKIDAVTKRGAAGVILINPPEADDPRVTALPTARGTSFNLGAQIPAIALSHDAADRLFRETTGRSLVDWRKKADASGGVTPMPQVSMTIAGGVERPRIPTDNVAAVLRGRGALAEEFVIVGGHYDHVGYGYFGSRVGAIGQIHPGADDNASGTAGVLLAAERLKQAYDALPSDTDARSIVFMGFGAEESGLNGSRYFVENMPFSVSQAQAMINLDMIGRMRDEQKLQIGGVETAGGFMDILKPIFDASGLPITPQGGGSGPSDHASFNAKGIPVLFFHTGLHGDYHAPSDEAWTINHEGAVATANLAADVALTLATMPQKLEFRETGTRRQMGAMPRARVRLGIAPGNYSDTLPGVMVGDVTPGTSAGDAGIQKGDRIIKWGGEELADVEQMMTMLAKHEPGEVVQIVVVREGQEITIPVTMKAPAPRGQ